MCIVSKPFLITNEVPNRKSEQITVKIFPPWSSLAAESISINILHSTLSNSPQRDLLTPSFRNQTSDKEKINIPYETRQ